MSYDVTFGHQQDYPCGVDTDRNYTSNVAPMWGLALGRNLGDLIDDLGGHNEALIPYLERGIAAMEADPTTYRAMEPANGWGNYEGALGYLRWMLEMCRAVPEGTVRVWR